MWTSHLAIHLELAVRLPRQRILDNNALNSNAFNGNAPLWVAVDISVEENKLLDTLAMGKDPLAPPLKLLLPRVRRKRVSTTGAGIASSKPEQKGSGMIHPNSLNSEVRAKSSSTSTRSHYGIQKAASNASLH